MKQARAGFASGAGGRGCAQAILLMLAVPLLLLCGERCAGAFTVALVVASNEGVAGDRPLEYAEEDATRVADALERANDGLRAHRLLGANAAALQEALAEIRAELAPRRARGEPIMLITYYSGHADADFLRMGGSRLTWSKYRELIRAVGAPVTISIVDACESGQVISKKGAQAGPSFSLDLERSGPSGIVWISSARSDEPSFESEELGGAFFSHFLISGLHGAADSDEDGAVTLEELYRYSYYGTIASTARELRSVQHPNVSVDLLGEGEVVLGRVSVGQASLVFGRDLAGTFLIARRFGDTARVVEVRKDPGRLVRASLPPGSYLVYRRDEDRVWLAPLELTSGLELVVEPKSLKPYAYRDVSPKGGRIALHEHSVAAGARIGSPIATLSRPCLGGLIRWDIRGHRGGWYASSALTRCGFSGVDATIGNLELRAEGGPTLSVGDSGFVVRARAGLLLGWVLQDAAASPYRGDSSVSSLAGGVVAGLGVECDLVSPLFLRVEVASELWIAQGRSGPTLRWVPLGTATTGWRF
ncbi:MAG: hypothetical protein IT384_16800 [Deltaproteobacteria bacterium]|nr:hypothetical protein [Deltaproteobacteria bacterium]